MAHTAWEKKKTAGVEEAAGAGVPAETAASLGAIATEAVEGAEAAEPPVGRMTCLECGRRVKVRGVLWRRCCLVKTERAS